MVQILEGQTMPLKPRKGGAERTSGPARIITPSVLLGYNASYPGRMNINIMCLEIYIYQCINEYKYN